jgi:hypothetical protein
LTHRPEATGIELSELSIGVSSFTRHLADGERQEICTLPVDTATMAMGARWGVADEIGFQGVDGIVSCSTFGCDGRYPVYVLRSEHRVKGVEAVFYIPSVEAESDRRLADAGVLQPDVDAGNVERNGYFHAVQESYSQVWDEICTSVHPADDCEPHVLTELEVTNDVLLGDPCHDRPAARVKVPPGRYVAVVWRHRGDTCRLGLYRIGSEDQEKTP